MNVLKLLSYECPKVAVLWNAVEQCTLSKGEHIKFDKHIILFGIINKTNKH